MSDTTAAKLREMRDLVPEESDALASSIEQVQDQITELSEQALAIETEIMYPDTSAAITIIETIILPDKGGDYVSYGSNFGAINWDPAGNLTDWDIMQVILLVPTIIYSYNRGDYPALDDLVDDYAFGNDYLTRPLYDSGLGSEASYGIYPTITNLELGEEYLTNNKTKIDNSESVFDRYIP
jgi:hypothetical protein